MTPLERNILIALFDYWDDGTPAGARYCRTSVGQIARFVDSTEPAVRAALDRLEAAGILRETEPGVAWRFTKPGEQ